MILDDPVGITYGATHSHVFTISHSLFFLDSVRIPLHFFPGFVHRVLIISPPEVPLWIIKGLFCELNHDDDDFSTSIWHVLFRLFFSSFSLLFHFSFLSSLPWIWHFVWRSSLLIDSFWPFFLPSVQYFYICLTSTYHGVNTFWSHNICSKQQLSNYFKQQKKTKKKSLSFTSIHLSIYQL